MEYQYHCCRRRFAFLSSEMLSQCDRLMMGIDQVNKQDSCRDVHSSALRRDIGKSFRFHFLLG